jgi:hypothetical protein
LGYLHDHFEQNLPGLSNPYFPLKRPTYLIIQSTTGVRTTTYDERLHRDLCNFHVGILGGSVGQFYMDVVARCLKGDFEDNASDAVDSEERIQSELRNESLEMKSTLQKRGTET